MKRSLGWHKKCLFFKISVCKALDEATKCLVAVVVSLRTSKTKWAQIVFEDSCVNTFSIRALRKVSLVRVLMLWHQISAQSLFKMLSQNPFTYLIQYTHGACFGIGPLGLAASKTQPSSPHSYFCPCTSVIVWHESSWLYVLGGWHGKHSVFVFTAFGHGKAAGATSWTSRPAYGQGGRYGAGGGCCYVLALGLYAWAFMPPAEDVVGEQGRRVFCAKVLMKRVPPLGFYDCCSGTWDRVRHLTFQAHTSIQGEREMQRERNAEARRENVWWQQH